MEQHLDEVSVWLAQSEIRREKLLARVLAQMQTITSDLQRPVHLKTVTIKISERELNDTACKVHGDKPNILNTTTMGIDDKLPGTPTADDVLPESNPCSSDTRNDQTSTLHYGFLPKMENEVLSIPYSRSAANCGTRILSDKAVLEAETTSTPNLEDQLLTDPKDSVSNSHFPGIKSLLFTSQLLPNLLKYSIEPISAKRCLQDYIQVDQPIFMKWLHSGSTKTRSTGHRRGQHFW